MRIPQPRKREPSQVIGQWKREHPGEEIPDGHVFTQPWPAGPKDKRRDQVIYYTYRADRARRTLHGIDEQVKKAQKAIDGHAPVKRNRFIQLEGAVKSVNRELEEKARTLAGTKGYKTNLAATPDGEPVTADFVTPPPTRSPTTSAQPSTPSTTPADLRTKLSQLRNKILIGSDCVAMS